MCLLKLLQTTFAAIFVFLTPFAVAEPTIVFSGAPATKIGSDSTGTERVVLSEENRQKSRLLIVKEGEKYFWASRSNTELIYFVSGAFHWFIAPGSGYIKIADTRLLLEDNGPRYRYIEHVGQFFTTYTYWGTSEDFAP